LNAFHEFDCMRKLSVGFERGFFGPAGVDKEQARITGRAIGLVPQTVRFGSSEWNFLAQSGGNRFLLSFADMQTSKYEQLQRNPLLSKLTEWP